MKYKNVIKSLEGLFNEVHDTYLKTKDSELIVTMRALMDIVTSSDCTFDNLYTADQYRIVIRPKGVAALPTNGYFISLIFSSNKESVPCDDEKEALKKELSDLANVSKYRSLNCESLEDVDPLKLAFFNKAEINAYAAVGFSSYLKGVRIKHVKHSFMGSIMKIILEGGALKVWVKREMDDKIVLWSINSCKVYGEDNWVDLHEYAQNRKALDLKSQLEPKPVCDSKIEPRRGIKFVCKNLAESQESKLKKRLAEIPLKLFNTYKTLGFSNFLKGVTITNTLLGRSGKVKETIIHRNKIMFVVEVDNGQMKEWIMSNCEYRNKDNKNIKLREKLKEIENADKV